MKSILKKTILSVLALALFFSFGTSYAKASDGDYNPKIKSIKGVTKSAMILRISCFDLKKKKVKIKVRVENVDDDAAAEIKIFEKRLDKDGYTKVRVNGLESSTEYAFKVRIKKSTDSSYSDFSSEVKRETDGDDD